MIDPGLLMPFPGKRPFRAAFGLKPVPGVARAVAQAFRTRHASSFGASLRGDSRRPEDRQEGQTARTCRHDLRKAAEQRQGPARITKRRPCRMPLSSASRSGSMADQGPEGIASLPADAPGPVAARSDNNIWPPIPKAPDHRFRRHWVRSLRASACGSRRRAR